MRRGHPGIGAWRNDSPRHFRPRGGGTPHYMPPRGFRPHESPRFRQHGPRPPRPFHPTYNPQPGTLEDHNAPDHRERNSFRQNSRLNNSPRNPERGSRPHDQRGIFPLLHKMRQEQLSSGNQYNDYYDNQSIQVNTMGDIDERHAIQNRSNQHVSPWLNPPFYEDQNQKHRHHDLEHNKMPVSDYMGHRPPSSDHYGGNPSSAKDNSFTHSVDDTVNIVRKRLLSRESQPSTDTTPADLHGSENTNRAAACSSSSNVRKEHTKKKLFRRPSVKVNCDKIKNKIVHQLFMMDKDKIHKLMDNPNSSTKFEYAISSLVTESQNSYNRHLRSVAEKSLYSSSSEFINNDNNTIYEDTFMKQMQCILDPQDTLFLEDIKPMVLAEISKVLQLDDLEQQRYEIDEQMNYPPTRDFSQYNDDTYHSNDYEGHETYGSIEDNAAYYEQNAPPNDCNRSKSSSLETGDVHIKEEFDSSMLFQRRKQRKSCNFPQLKISSPERHKQRIERKNIDLKSSEEKYRRSVTPNPLTFDAIDEDCRSIYSPNHNAITQDTCRESAATTKSAIHDDKSPKDRRTVYNSNPLQLDTIDVQEKYQESVNEPPVSFDANHTEKKSFYNLNSLQFDVNTTQKYHDRLVSSNLPTFDVNPSEDKTCANSPSQFNANTTQDKYRKSSVSPQLNPADISPLREKYRRSTTPIPLFNPNSEDLSNDDDDPFAELDRQYHVAVDHHFITHEPYSPQREVTKIELDNVTCKSHTEKISVTSKPDIKTPYKTSFKIEQEIEDQLQNIAKSPLKLFTQANVKHGKDIDENQQEKEGLLDSSSDINVDMKTPTKSSNNQETVSKNTNTQDDKEPVPKCSQSAKSERSNSIVKTSLFSNPRKRSTDQRPSHRKEKRKKSDASQSEPSQKQILNKNIIINVNDCAVKNKEKCDAPKSVFNLFFAKEKGNKDNANDSKKNNSDDKGYSDKYVKRKDVPKKVKECESKKKYDSSILSHSSSNTYNSEQTPTKFDGQPKFKTIDIFENQTKKASNVHQAHRNTAPAHNDNKPISRKVTKRHVTTQVITKASTKETQTIDIKKEKRGFNTRFTQTDRKKLISKTVQTDPVFFKTETKSTDAFERMKAIDMEIQVLLQEKFKLYNSMEPKESSVTNTMQSLGMAVFPLNDTNTNNDEEVTESTLNTSEDTIVDEFTSIPTEELEQIALESITEQNIYDRRSQRRKVLEQERKTSLSPATSTASTQNKRRKTPNVSLIEQIISDDRPLEDIISLDDFEDAPLKPKAKTQSKSSKKNKKTKQTPKKKAVSKSPNFAIICSYYGIKECSVKLLRKNLSKYLTTKVSTETPKVEEISTKLSDTEDPEPEIIKSESPVKEETPVEEPVVNDLQIDMMDVSEDIVIGDSCEVKSCGEKDINDINDSSDVPLSEEIILDNSQSSIEDATISETQNENVCKMFDYGADESLRRDTITVMGNAEAVLAIECIESDFIAACLDGNVYHYSGDGQLINTLRGSNLAVTCLTIVKEKYGTTIYTGSLDSRIRYYDLESGLEKGPECNVLSPIQTMDRAWDTIFVGTRTGFVLQFECKNNMLIPVSTVKFSDQSILALRAMKEGPRKVLLVASRSEAVTIKDAQTGLLLRTLEGPKMTVYTLLFEDGKVYCGTSSHHIHVFDYSSGSHVGSHEGGKGAVCLRSRGGLLFAGCYDGCVYVYRDGETRPLAQLRGPQLMLLSLAVQGTQIIAGYKDRSLYIWKIPLSILQEMIL